MQVLAPFAGQVIDLAAVPDPVFSASLVGGGLALLPSGQPDSQAGGQDFEVLARAPIAGYLHKIHPHAYVIISGENGSGQGILVHLGLDTVGLKGQSFHLLAAVGQYLEAGQGVIGWSPRRLEEQGYQVVCPIIALDHGQGALSEVAAAGTDLAPGDLLYTL